MSTLTELEFLLVSNDYATLTAVSGGVKKYGAKLGLVPTAEAAMTCQMTAGFSYAVEG